MQIDKTALDRLLSLDDMQHSQRRYARSRWLPGSTDRLPKPRFADLRLVRASLSNASDADINQAIGMLGEQKVRALLEALGKI